jgi:cystathionine beta-lyase/cystathionine gamma-synthase
VHGESFKIGGIDSTLVRLSVGLEMVEALLVDLDATLA